MKKVINFLEYLSEVKCMSSIFEVSDYFLSVMPMTHKKLQKMCYYAYAWYYTLYDKLLFDDGMFEAWIHGPVNRKLYNRYKNYGWREIPQNKKANIDKDIGNFLDTIIDTFGIYDANELESMTHAEQPWKNARKGYAVNQSCEVKIDNQDIKEYYGALYEVNQCD